MLCFKGNILRKITIYWLIVLGLLVSACGPLPPVKTVANAPQDAGISKEFNGDVELIIAAAQASVKSLDLDITHSTRGDIGYTILFRKSMSAFSWGETGRVLVEKITPSKTRVFVHSEKNRKYQITGTEEAEFAVAIFQGIDEALASRK